MAPGFSRVAGNDVLVAAVKLGKILQEPLRISPNISLKKAWKSWVAKGGHDILAIWNVSKK